MADLIVIYCSRATQGLFVLCIVLINIKVKSIWCPSFKRLHPVTICTSSLQLSSWPKVSSFVRCIKKQLITLQNFNIQTCYSQFLWFFSLKCWFIGQIISRIHLILPNAYKLIEISGMYPQGRPVRPRSHLNFQIP